MCPFILTQFGQAGRLRVAVESQVLAQFQEGDVTVLFIIVLRVREVLFHIDCLFTSVGITNVVFTGNNFYAVASTPKEMTVNARERPKQSY